MILVTGGTGFLGSTLIGQLIDQGVAVVATKRPQSKIPDRLLSSSLIQWIDADLQHYFELEDAFQGISQVYHCGALVSFQKEDMQRLQEVNVQGTAHIVNLALTYGVRLLHVSSVSTLGTPKNTNRPSSEENMWEYDRSASGYALSKYQSEMEVWRGIHEGLDAVIVNPAVILGAAAGDQGSGAIFSMIDKGLKFYPKGTIGVVDVEDVATIMRLLMEKKEVSGERFVINHINLPNRDLLRIGSVLMGKPEPSIAVSQPLLKLAASFSSLISYFSKKRPALTRATAEASSAMLQYSDNKLQELLHYQYRPLEQTINEIANLYKTNTTKP